MKQAIEWYMDNTTVMNPSRSYQETFHDLGMNLRMRAEQYFKDNFESAEKE